MVSKSVEREADKIERRLSDAEVMTKFMLGVYESQMARAEQLRKLAVAVANSQGDFDRRRKTRTVNNVAVQRLAAMVEGMLPFYMPPKPSKAKSTKRKGR